jgi:hypothetical protein
LSVGASFSYKYDTVTFVAVEPFPAAEGPQPKIHIDTNIKISGFFGGTVKSSAPYSIGIDYTDTTFNGAEVEFTKVVVTYDDGTEDTGAAALKLPLSFPAQPYESTNSVTGGRIVKTKLLVISGKIPGAISRDKPITLLIEGHFINSDGAEVPFAIKQKYNVEKDQSTKSWSEVMSGV